MANFRKTIGEIFQLLDRAKTKKERLELLRKYDCPQVRTIIKINFDSSIKFLLPPGTPAYEPLIAHPEALETGEAQLWSELRKFYIYLNTGNLKITPEKRESLFRNLLEGLHPYEAELLIRLKDKKLKCGLTRAIVDDAYPGLLPPIVKSDENVASEVRTEDSKS